MDLKWWIVGGTEGEVENARVNMLKEEEWPSEAESGEGENRTRTTH